MKGFTQLMNLLILIKLKHKKAATKVETIGTVDGNAEELYTDDEPKNVDKVKEERADKDEETNVTVDAIDVLTDDKPMDAD